MLEIDRFLSSKDDIKIILLGGDDILIQYDYERYGTQIVDEISKSFKASTGLSMSGGIGLSINQAILSLDLAKKNGKNQVQRNIVRPLHKMKDAILYIFVDSDIPDVYINSVIACQEEKRNIELRKVCLVGITRDKNSIALSKYLESVSDRIKKQLELLKKGKYLHKDTHTKQWQEKDIEIQEHEKLRYAAASNIKFETEPLLYHELKAKLDK